MSRSAISKPKLLAGAVGFCAALVLVVYVSLHASTVAGDVADANAKSNDQASKPAQLWTCGMHPQVILPHPGNCPICHMKLTPLKSTDEESAPGGKKTVAYWWDPMLGPASITDHPGKSAMGMDLVPVYEDTVQSGPGVRIDPTVVQNIGVITAAVRRGSIDVSVQAVGMLKPPEPGVHDITLKINGYIQKLYANTDGMAVAKGDVLFDLYSPDVMVAAQELSVAQQGLKSLGANASDAARAEATAMAESAKRKLRLWDIDERDLETIANSKGGTPTVPIRSPVDGHIVDKAIVQGSAVQAGMKLMRIEDHHTLWLDVQVFEDQAGLIAIGQEVRATIDGLPGQTFTGTISFIYPHVDHMARTQLVRTTLQNPQHELRPGMYATANIMIHPVNDAIVVPREAVIDTGTRQIAFVADAALPGHFEPRNVTIGTTGSDGNVQVLSGLAPGEHVVVSGQFLLDVESRTTEAIQKLRSPPMTPTTQP
jgi:RND family efflux transporter MFP subunit